MTNLARVVIVPTVTSKIELLCYGYYVDPRPIFVVAKTSKALVNHVVNFAKDKKERYDGETLYYILHIDALIDAIKRLPAVRNSKELTNFKKLLPNIFEDYIKSDLEDKLEPVEEVKREITEHVSKTEEEVEEFLTENQLHLEDDEFFIQESKIQLAAEANAKRVMLKSKIEAEDFLKECEEIVIESNDRKTRVMRQLVADGFLHIPSLKYMFNVSEFYEYKFFNSNGEVETRHRHIKTVDYNLLRHQAANNIFPTPMFYEKFPEYYERKVSEHLSSLKGNLILVDMVPEGKPWYTEECEARIQRIRKGAEAERSLEAWIHTGHELGEDDFEEYLNLDVLNSI